VNGNILSQQLQHLQKADRIPYTYAIASGGGGVGGAAATKFAAPSTIASYADAAKLAMAGTAVNCNSSNNKGSMPNVKTESGVNIQAGGGGGGAVTSISAGGELEDGDDGAEQAENCKVAAMSAESEEAIQKLNPLTWPSNPRHAKFYVIKSFGEDDVHKSIKYNLWCSTERGNRKLDEAFNESRRINAANHNQAIHCKEDENASKGGPSSSRSDYIDARDTVRGCPVYLFFSVNRSGCFCGMAQMISNYYKERHFGSWVQDGKWQGSFIVKWIYVKDIPNKDLKDIQLPNNDNRPVTFSRDTQEIPFNQGVEMLKRFIKYEPKTNILQDFKYYDDRERDIKQKRTQHIILQQLQQQQQQQGAAPMAPPGGAVVTAAASTQHQAPPPPPVTTLYRENDAHSHSYASHRAGHAAFGHARKYQAQSHSHDMYEAGGAGGGAAYSYGGGRGGGGGGGGRGRGGKYTQYRRPYYSKNSSNEHAHNSHKWSNFGRARGGAVAASNNVNARYRDREREHHGHATQHAHHVQSRERDRDQSQYGNLQILARKNNHSHNSHSHAHNEHGNENNVNAANANMNMMESEAMHNGSNSPNRSRYNNRNRNRWVQKT